MLLQASFCCIVFSDVQSAALAHKEIHLKRCLTQHGQPLYLTFLPSAPEINNENHSEFPEGLTVIQNFISPEEEQDLLSSISLENLPTKSDMKNRRVRHFGYEFIYGKNNIDVDKPLEEKIPSSCDFLWKNFESHSYTFEKPPDQLTINQYVPGQGIPSHVDTHSAFLSPLISLSLGSDIVMEFKKIDDNGIRHCYKQLLPARSVLLLDGPARYEWSHGIVPKTYDIINGQVKDRNVRTSFTFRWVRFDGICKCLFHQQCDSYAKQASDLTIAAPIIEREHVHRVYEEIAGHFSETRTKIWPCVQNFVDKLNPGSTLIDVGCGNGKNMNIRNDILSIGLEYNGTLASHAAWKNTITSEETTNSTNLNQILQGDCLNLPFSTGCADAVISIAVFHHLVTEERRVRAIKEVIRILRSEGVALISVWAQDQNKDGVKSSYLKQDRKNRTSGSEIVTSDLTESIRELTDNKGNSLQVNLPIHTNRKQFLYQDMLVPWKLKSSDKAAVYENKKVETFMRYYHVFQEGELERLCKKFDNIVVEDSFYEQGNWCIIIKKQ